MIHIKPNIRGKVIFQDKRMLTIFLLALIFILALFLRSAFYYNEAFEEAGIRGEPKLSGNDPYYHKRVIDTSLSTHKYLQTDHLLNFPVFAQNPQPPLFDWSVTMVGMSLSPIFAGDVDYDHALGSLFFIYKCFLN